MAGKSYMKIPNFQKKYVSIYNYFAEQTRFFREEFLTLLGTIDIYFIADTKDSSYLYYRNCAVKVTHDSVCPFAKSTELDDSEKSSSRPPWPGLSL